MLTANAQIQVTDKVADGGFALVAKEQPATIVVSKSDGPTVLKVAQLWAADVEAVTGYRPKVSASEKHGGRQLVVMGTVTGHAFIRDLSERGLLDVTPIAGGWEQYIIKVVEHPAKNIDRALVIAGSDRRGVAYGAFELSRLMGVSPWAWWSDVPAAHSDQLFVRGEMVSKRPSVKYRGIFINDEDWGLLPWAAKTFEPGLGDIGPRTYAKVCELLLRLKANMLAPAMHTCTGAFYYHKESKLVADTFGVIITTSHCEPLLLNNAAPTEWDTKRDGEWNYKTNAANIRQKWEQRLGEASRFENIYTLAMRGLHDEGLRGSLPMSERVPLIEQVISDQRQMLERHKQQAARQIPQIFVPYKETMDIYENGLRVPDDVTLVWVDDNYGYMKRVSSPDEQRRSGGAGVYYHLSYMGTPHDYLWLNSTPPVLMYEELMKAYHTGADRYWLLNVGDIKPMELGMQTFFDLAWSVDDYDIRSINRHQSRFLASIFGQQYERDLQWVLDEYYRLCWIRKPEYMGFEWEWSEPERTGLRDTEFSFRNYNEAQRRLADYQAISDRIEAIGRDLADALRAPFFEMMGYQVKASYQMNRKFLMAQLNHEQLAQGRRAEANWAARQMEQAYDSILSLNREFNTMLGGKWRGIMDVPPGICALYQNKPAVTYTEGAGETPADLSIDVRREWVDGCMLLNLTDYQVRHARHHQIRLVGGMGYDWQVLQLGDPVREQPCDPTTLQSPRADYALPAIAADSIAVTVYSVPFFPLYQGRSTDIGVSIDHQQPRVYRNEPVEWSPEWKEQVMRNGHSVTFRFPIDRHAPNHTLSFVLGDPGMMIQRVIIDWGGRKSGYLY